MSARSGDVHRPRRRSSSRSYDSPSQSSPSSSSSSSSSSSPVRDLVLSASCGREHCQVCERELPPCLSSACPSWSAIVQVALYSLHVCEPETSFFSLQEEIFPFIAAHRHRLGANKQVLLCSDEKKWRKKIQDCISHKKDVFRSGKVHMQKSGFWALEDPSCDPWRHEGGPDEYADEVPADDFCDVAPQPALAKRRRLAFSEEYQPERPKEHPQASAFVQLLRQSEDAVVSSITSVEYQFEGLRSQYRILASNNNHVLRGLFSMLNNTENDMNMRVTDLWGQHLHLRQYTFS